MKIRVDPEGCTGHGRCNAVAPEVYELDEEGYNAGRHDGIIEVPEGLEAAALLGMRACPERIITVLEEAAPEPAATDSSGP
jgi:ferredoxin